MIIRIVCMLIIFALATFYNVKMRETHSSQMRIVYAVETILYWQMLLLMIYKLAG